jgi:hypothetical protein
VSVLPRSHVWVACLFMATVCGSCRYEITSQSPDGRVTRYVSSDRATARKHWQLAVLDATRPATRPAGEAKVAHVVVAWLKKPGDATARDAIVHSSASLRSIPGVVEVRAGEVIPSSREVVDSTYDIGILVTFRDEAAMRAYGNHPAHQKVVEEVIKPHVERYRVYDFRIAP